MTKEEVFASRFFGTALELKLLLGAVLLGALLGAAYDVLRALRISVSHRSFAVFLEDALFALLSGICFYAYCTELCRGQLRFFVLAGMAAGFFAYLMTLGRIVCRGFACAVKVTKKVLYRLGKLLKKTAAILCGLPFFQKKGGKIEENPCPPQNGDV